jgi:AraC-like DNA-binding protein
MPIHGAYTPYELERVNNAVAYINQHYKDTISPDQIAIEVGIDIKLLQEIMQFLTGLTVHNFQAKVRL